ncbi:synaptonemal complex protein 1-like protein [Lates japonicus]|uniref:Synaptonemal complex protein 1-like protein n=1 Tax=Lates japonicus TaxID=270547 RepID=A0AAD3MS92_LATJO|nr:synaptonemal complex protein 1-like protein [Lates japonicus]
MVPRPPTCLMEDCAHSKDKFVILKQLSMVASVQEKENHEVVQNQLKLSQEKLAAELKTEKENHEVLQNQFKLSQEKLAAELKTEKEINEVVQNQLKLSQEKLAAELKTEKENHEVLQNQLKLSQEKLAAEQLEEHNDLPQEEETETAPRKSTFKRFRHFLGLRKPQRWKRPAVPASTSGD